MKNIIYYFIMEMSINYETQFFPMPARHLSYDISIGQLPGMVLIVMTIVFQFSADQGTNFSIENVGRC